MGWRDGLTLVGFFALSGVWYGLQAYALRDLIRRPRVRGDNKVLWALGILCLPFVGALLYLSVGPTSFLPRPSERRPRPGATRPGEPPRAEG